MYSELKNVELPIVKTLHVKLRWDYISSSELDKHRDSYENPFIISILIESILKLNKNKGVTESHVTSIIHKLKRIESNEEFSKWLKGEKSFKINQSEKAVTIKLIDFDDPTNNTYTITNQFKQSISHGVIENEKHIKPDIVLFVNGIPTTVIECKVVSTEDSTWHEGVKQLKRYQKHSPLLFIPNCFNVSTDGHILKYAATGSPSKYFFEWKYDNGLPSDFDESQSEFFKYIEGNEYNPFIDSAIYGLFNRQYWIQYRKKLM